MDGTLLHLQRNSVHVHAQIIACIAWQGLPGKSPAERPQDTEVAKMICVLLVMQ